MGVKAQNEGGGSILAYSADPPTADVTKGRLDRQTSFQERESKSAVFRVLLDS